MAAPTRISVAASAFGASTSPKTISSISVQSGDLIVVRSTNENAAETFNTPTSTGLTFTAGPNVGSTGSTGRAAVWTAPITSSGTISVALTVGGTTTQWWGFTVSVWRNHGGVGNSGSVNQTAGTGAPAISITTSGANSGVDWATADFNAIDGTSRTYTSVNGSPSTEDQYFRDSVHYATYHAYVPDAGTAGAKTVGVSAPTGQKFSGVAVEILAGTGGGGTTTNVTLSASAGSSASMLKQVGAVRAAATASAATVARQAGKALAATAGSSAVLVRQAAKVLAASAGSSASIAATKVKLVVLSASAGSSAAVSVIRSRVLTLAATAAASAVMAKAVRKNLAATEAASASVVAVGPGGAPAAPAGQRPTLGVG